MNAETKLVKDRGNSASGAVKVSGMFVTVSAALGEQKELFFFAQDPHTHASWKRFTLAIGS